MIALFIGGARFRILRTRGLCLFVGMAISGLPMDKLIRPLLPFLAAIVAVLLLIAFVPELTLVVPRALGFVR